MISMLGVSQTLPLTSIDQKTGDIILQGEALSGECPQVQVYYHGPAKNPQGHNHKFIDVDIQDCSIEAGGYKAILDMEYIAELSGVKAGQPAQFRVRKDSNHQWSKSNVEGATVVTKPSKMKAPTYEQTSSYFMLKWDKLTSVHETGGADILYYMIQIKKSGFEFKSLRKEK